MWNDLFDLAWTIDDWAVNWPGLEPLSAVMAAWTPETPLRRDVARRAALVEIDALVAVWLGLNIDELLAILRARFPVVAEREDRMWFDANGRRIAANYNQWGHGQTKQHFEQLMAYLEAEASTPPPDGYMPPFYKADRESEYRQAHAVFSKRLQDAIDAGWSPS